MTSELHAARQRRRIDAPEPGYFSMRLVKGGWRVPCRIVHDAHGWHAEINGEVQPAFPDPYAAPGVSRVHERGLRIDQPTYDRLIALKAYAEAHEPDHPAANPLRAIDPMQLQPIIPRTPHR
jgi:hypothetical protein